MTTAFSPAVGSPARSRQRTKKKTPSGAAGGRLLMRGGGRVARGGLGSARRDDDGEWGRAGRGGSEKDARARGTRDSWRRDGGGWVRASASLRLRRGGRRKEKKRREKCLKDGLVPNDNRGSGRRQVPDIVFRTWTPRAAAVRGPAREAW